MSLSPTQKHKLTILAMAYFLSLALFGTLLIASGTIVNAGDGSIIGDEPSIVLAVVAWASIGLATAAFGAIAAWIIIKGKRKDNMQEESL